ncbi:uncharacterized protein BJX67DRAFT_377437 [Aspergillus lucknowensis]|uniref:Uncharacterized protein n=1 Tax=Aspergillus lucknowensis TaxID=176173 RepID=A0ABR4M508_9EURO
MAQIASTHHKQVHTPVPDGTESTDEVIILILGVVVFATFALGLVSQLCDTSILFFRRKQLWELDDEEYGFRQPQYPGSIERTQQHQMSELEAGAVPNNLATESLKNGDRADPTSHYPRWATRYGSIIQHDIVSVNGARKMVLVVDIDADSSGHGVQDGYTEWFRKWQQRREANICQERDGPWLDESAPLLGTDREEPASAIHPLQEVEVN